MFIVTEMPNSRDLKSGHTLSFAIIPRMSTPTPARSQIDPTPWTLCENLHEVHTIYTIRTMNKRKFQF